MKKNWGILGLLLVLFFGMMGLNFMNTGSLGGADSYMHHMFGKWAFQHPKLFFDQWGKPLFTIFSAPLAQFGFKGSVTFNIITSLFSGFLVYKTAQKLELANAWIGIPITVFAPMFFMMAFSSMTEIIFAFNLILAVFLFVDRKYIWSAIAISFIPFARTEGVIFLPLFFITFLSIRKYSAIPILLSGYMIMTLLGYPFLEDWFWPITTMPYGDSSALYGSGKLMHFVNYSPDIFGWPLIVSFLIGLVGMGFFLVKNYSIRLLMIVFLILSCAVGYFAAHSVVWAYGLGGSFGLIRVMAGIVPLVALISIWGINLLVKTTRIPSNYVKVALGVLTIVFATEAFTKHDYPIKKGQEEIVIDRATDYIKKENLNEKYIVYYNPYGAFALGLDHFSKQYSKNQVFVRETPSSNLPDGSIIIWDAHFSPNEGGLPKENLYADSNLVLLKDFQPEWPFKTWKDDAFEVLVFQKK